MNLYALFPTITSVLFLFMGLFVYLKNKKQLINQVYLLFCLSVFLWLFPFSLMYWSRNIITAYHYAKIGFIGVLTIPICMFYFVAVFLNKDKQYEKMLKILTILTIPCAIINFFTPVFYSGIKICFWGYYPIAGKLYFIILLQFLVLFCYAILLLLKNVHNPNFSAIKQQQTKYILVAFCITSFGGVDYITKYPLELYPFGYILILLFIVIMAMSIIKYNLMDIKLAVTKTFIWVFIYLFILLSPIWIGYKTGQWLISCIVLFILSTSGQFVANYFQKKAEEYLLAEQERYQQLLMQASTGMIEKDYDISRLSKLIVRIIKKSVKISFVSLYIFDEEKNLYVNIESRGRDKKVLKDFPKDTDFIDFMKKTKKPFFLSALPEQYKSKIMKINSGITLIIPSIFKDKVIGFLFLGDKENRTLYSARDVEVFGVLSNQAALAIENCLFLERSQRQQKRLFEAEKLASIGGMADGMAHQIRNRLNSFGLAAELLSYDVKDFSEDHKAFIEQHPNINEMIKSMNELILSINENVKKTNTVLTGILDFAKPKGSVTNKETFSMKEIIDPAVMLVQVKHHREKVPIVLDIPSDNDKIYGIKYQIQEVCFNCIDNAFEAIIEKEQHMQNPLINDIDKAQPFVPEIKVSLRYLTDKNQYQIIIKDNGIGIKPENKAKIFSAFFTTKPSSKSGSGIGSYVARRMIVEAHDGDMSFESRYGEGTTFTITLPLSSKKEKDNLV